MKPWIGKSMDSFELVRDFDRHRWLFDCKCFRQRSIICHVSMHLSMHLSPVDHVRCHIEYALEHSVDHCRRLRVLNSQPPSWRILIAEKTLEVHAENHGA